MGRSVIVKTGDLFSFLSLKDSTVIQILYLKKKKEGLILVKLSKTSTTGF